jgi:malonyl CoA-acyl carrier protein transacylase
VAASFINEQCDGTLTGNTIARFAPAVFIASQVASTAALIELGPGKVLTGLTKRIEKSLNANAVLDLASVTAILQEIK